MGVGLELTVNKGLYVSEVPHTEITNGENIAVNGHSEGEKRGIRR